MHALPRLMPPVEWWYAAAAADCLTLHAGARYRKTDSLSRFAIASAEGSLLLSVPLVGGRRQRGLPICDLQIDYSSPWALRHWRSIASAYGRAPYFEAYGAIIEQWLRGSYSSLAHMAISGIDICRNILLPELSLRINWEDEPAEADKRPGKKAPVYHQVFGDRHGFLPDLSVIDMLMNEGRLVKVKVER